MSYSARFKSVAIAVVLAGFLVGCGSAEETANGLYVSAADKIAKGLQTANPVERYGVFSEAAAEAEKIIKDYRTTSVAVKISGNEKIGKLTLEELKAALKTAEADPAICLMKPTFACLTERLKQDALALVDKVKNRTATETQQYEFQAQTAYLSVLDEAGLIVIAGVFGASPEQLVEPASMLSRVALVQGLDPAKKLIDKYRKGRQSSSSSGRLDNPFGLFSLGSFAQAAGFARIAEGKELFLSARPEASAEAGNQLSDFIPGNVLLSEEQIGSLMAAWPSDQLHVLTNNLLYRSNYSVPTAILKKAYIASTSEADRAQIASDMKSYAKDLDAETRFSLLSQSTPPPDSYRIFDFILKFADKPGEVAKLKPRIMKLLEGVKAPAPTAEHYLRYPLIPILLDGTFSRKLPDLISTHVVAVAPEIAIKSCHSLADALPFGSVEDHTRIIEACLPLINKFATQTADNSLGEEARFTYEILLRTAAKHGERPFEMLITKSTSELLKVYGSYADTLAKEASFLKLRAHLKQFMPPQKPSGSNLDALYDRLDQGDKSALGDLMALPEDEQWQFIFYQVMRDGKSTRVKDAVKNYAREKFAGRIAVNSDHGVRFARNSYFLPLDERLALAQKAAKTDSAFERILTQLLWEKIQDLGSKRDVPAY